ncbi:hypothetical protein ACOMHN_014507 [Nucella lapillus]
MADDLEDEWWKGSDDSTEDAAGEDGGQRGEKESPQKGVKHTKKGVKRSTADREDEADSSAVPAKKQKSATKEKDGKKNKKKKKTFARKKITEVDEDVLKKGGTPADVQSLLRPISAVSKSDDSHSESDDSDDAAMLSPETDFFPANPEQSPGAYLEELLPGWAVAVKEAKVPPGSPLMLVLCSSAIRAVQLNRELKSFLGKDCKTAKLFAKHMKLGEQKTFLEKKVCHASIGTPNRVQALLESGSLKLKQTHAVVLDWNWRDIKLKRMADIPDVRRDLTKLLKEHFVDHIKNTTCRIAIL